MTATGVRPVTSADLASVRGILERDPIAHAFVDARVRVAGTDPWRLGGDLWGYFADGELESLAYVGANLIPIETTPAARAAFAARLRLVPRRCSSLAGPAAEVLDLWRLLEPAWGPARDVRPNQPLLAIDGSPAVPGDPLVRSTDIGELDQMMPPCVAMFIEEVGVSPVAGNGASAYRARIAELIRAGRQFARIDGDVVAFKAEVGVVTPVACQVQGVFVPPQLRGRGIAVPAMAAVVERSIERFAPIVSLYVNDYNTAARKVYAKVGFTQVGTFATVHL